MPLVLLRCGNPRRMLTWPVWRDAVLACQRLGAIAVASPAHPPAPAGETALPAGLVHPVDEDVGPDQLRDLLAGLGADRVLSTSDPDSATWRDACAVAALAPAAAQPAAVLLDSIGTALHKGRTRDLCLRAGVPVARGAWARDGATAIESARGLQAPLVVKEVSGWSGQGMRVHHDLAGA